MQPYETHIKDSAPPLAIKMELLSLPFVKYMQFIALNGAATIW